MLLKPAERHGEVQPVRTSTSSSVQAPLAGGSGIAQILKTPMERMDVQMKERAAEFFHKYGSHVEWNLRVASCSPPPWRGMSLLDTYFTLVPHAFSWRDCPSKIFSHRSIYLSSVPQCMHLFSLSVIAFCLWHSRGYAHRKKGNFKAAVADYSEVRRYAATVKSIDCL